MDSRETASSFDGRSSEDSLVKSQPQEEDKEDHVNSEKLIVSSLVSSESQLPTVCADNDISIEAGVTHSESPSPMLGGSPLHPSKLQGGWNKPLFIAEDTSQGLPLALEFSGKDNSEWPALSSRSNVLENMYMSPTIVFINEETDSPPLDSAPSLQNMDSTPQETSSMALKDCSSSDPVHLVSNQFASLAYLEGEEDGQLDMDDCTDSIDLMTPSRKRMLRERPVKPTAKAKELQMQSTFVADIAYSCIVQLASFVGFRCDSPSIPRATPFQQYTPITIRMGMAPCLGLNSGNLVLKSYETVAVWPMNQYEFDLPCFKINIIFPCRSKVCKV
ncbi:unnamed protein product [Brassica oleracea var. botrytis]|uniref:(rape) hypothetical protein n=1 Tax=Brassica napus TaxID=3708 RepID=A0A816MLB5_BRANA|nr:unnamed protein product [Brassica napus]